MSNDKDSAVLGELDALREKIARELMLHHDIDPDVFIGMHKGYGHWLDAADAALAAIKEIPRQPTQSDALREVVIEECAKALEADAEQCDCFAREEGECACGAWCEWKSITSDKAVKIVRELKNVPPPEGDGGHRRSDGGEVGK